jgi:hypothetical protein
MKIIRMKSKEDRSKNLLSEVENKILWAKPLNNFTVRMMELSRK